LSPGGTIVSYGVLGGDVVASASAIDIIFKDLTYRGFYLDKQEYAAQIPSLIAQAAELVATGQLHVPIAGIYKLDQLSDAVAHAQKGGKVLLKIGTRP
jgi:NADPH:quinone reductase-like Zn-dependent oxidoreductase